MRARLIAGLIAVVVPTCFVASCSSNSSTPDGGVGGNGGSGLMDCATAGGRCVAPPTGCNSNEHYDTTKTCATSGSFCCMTGNDSGAAGIGGAGGSAGADASAGSGGVGGYPGGSGGAAGQDASAGTGGNAGADAAAGSGGAGGIGGAGGSAPVCGDAGTCGPLEECGTITAGGTRACVAKSISVSAPLEAGTVTYTIDATEVTRAQYQAWLVTNPPFPTVPSGVCDWKKDDAGVYSFAPDPTCMIGSNVCQDPDGGTGNCNQHPQVCIDWCDAYAYCQGIGKRLCGKVGGGSADFNNDWNQSQDQWYNACTAGTAGNSTPNTYPYPPADGGSYGKDTCNGEDYWLDKDAYDSATTTPAGGMQNCTYTSGNYAGIFDLSGNVWEWEDSCDGTGLNEPCRLGGGSFYNSYNQLECDMNFSYNRQYDDESIGFRCCGS